MISGINIYTTVHNLNSGAHINILRQMLNLGPRMLLSYYFFSPAFLLFLYKLSPESKVCKSLHCTHSNVCDAFCFMSFLFKYQTNIISAGVYSVLLSIGTQLVQICSGDADVTFVKSIKLLGLNWLAVRPRASLWAFWQERVNICMCVCVCVCGCGGGGGYGLWQRELIHQAPIVSVVSDVAVLTVFGPVLFRADTAPGRSPR